MQKLSAFLALLLCTFLIASGAAVAQEASDDPWFVVEAQWSAEEQGDDDWVDRFLADDFVGWGKESPAPRSKRSTAMWDRISDKQSRMVAHELYLQALIVHDEVAVAHYLYSAAYEDDDGGVETRNGRFTDVLVRTADGWKFIAWHGGAGE